MSNNINEQILENLYENELEKAEVEYIAYVKYDGVKLARISAHSADALAEELYKLEESEDRQRTDNVMLDFNNGAHEPDYDLMIKDGE